METLKKCLEIWDFAEKIMSPSLDRSKKYFLGKLEKIEHQGRSIIKLRIECEHSQPLKTIPWATKSKELFFRIFYDFWSKPGDTVGKGPLTAIPLIYPGHGASHKWEISKMKNYHTGIHAYCTVHCIGYQNLENNQLIVWNWPRLLPISAHPHAFLSKLIHKILWWSQNNSRMPQHNPWTSQ